jgi:2-phosphoglycerate kinase
LLRNQMIYWIGGSACAGKSTLARMYAEKHGMELYSCDEHFDRHLKEVSISEYPAMYKVSTMNPNEAFYTREVQEQLRVYKQSFIEDFSFVIKDLAKKTDTPLVVEGNQILPSLLVPYLEEHHKAIWIIPTEQFQREHYSRRGWIQGILQNTADPTVAFNNWMSRDALFSEFIQKEASELNLNVLKVDGSKTLQENFEYIENYFRT